MDYFSFIYVRVLTVDPIVPKMEMRAFRDSFAGYDNGLQKTPYIWVIGKVSKEKL